MKMNLPRKILVGLFLFLFPTLVIAFLLVLKIFQSVNPQFTDKNSSNFEYILLVLLAFILSLLISFGIGLLISQLFLKPIKHINQVAKIISTGNLGLRINYFGKNELGELAQNINLIINNLATGMQSMANSLRNEKKKEEELAANNIELARTSAKDEALLKNIGDAVVAVDERKKIFLFNQAATILTNFQADEVLGRDYDQVLKFEFEKEGGEVADFIHAALDKQLIDIPNHIVIKTKDGQKIPITQISTSILLDSSKETYGAVVVLRNISKERQLDHLKDEFISIASHELRTPMTAIKGLISMIFEGDYGEINPDLKDPLADVAASTNRLIQLVNDMLDVSRIEGGRIKYIYSIVKVSDLISEIVNLLQPVAKQKGIEIKFDQVGSELVQADANKVRQILSNLIGNSLKFTDQGYIEVRYAVHDEVLIVSVKDTGIGIVEEDQKKLFSKFQQITTSQFGRPVGTGLGLYISREFARKMGGELWIAYSFPAQGSVFSFSLPLAYSNLAKKIVAELGNNS